ncbi:MAG: PilZ domain-containing protein [Candidatus Accumulibacter sp.]|jgi:hypothetical protein|nr:PilZ domain-containing protein [Accumulibacter sp.]
MGQERRKHVRVAFHAPATLTLSDRTLDVVVLDLSLRGALVRLPAGTAMGDFDSSSCKLCVRLDEMLAGIDMETRIVHLEGRYAGLLCLSIDLDSVTHLRRLVELNLGDPALLDRELPELVIG